MSRKDSGDRAGYLRLPPLWGVPLFIHWSYPIGGVGVALYASIMVRKLQLVDAAGYFVGYTLLILVHELGHAVAARTCKLRVLAVEMTGAGGLCLFEAPTTNGQAILVTAGGLIGQAALFAGTLAALSVFGVPDSAFARCLAGSFTVINAAIALLNVLPFKGGKFDTDGYTLWHLCLNALKGEPYPQSPALPLEQAPVFSPETSLLSKEGFAPQGFKCGIEVLNDRTTPMQFVVDVFGRHLRLSEKDAIDLMLRIHNTGGAVIPLESQDAAAKAAAAIAAEAAAQGHRFTCRAVSA